MQQAIDYFDEKGIRDIKAIAAYHLQQATEKLIKYQIYQSGASISNSQVYTHAIDRLITYADSLGIPFVAPDYIREHSVVISDWEAGSRYDVGFSVRINTLKRVYDVIEKWEEQIR